MQQTLEIGWWQSARMGGILRYHWKAISRTLGMVLLILLVSQLLSLVIPMLTGNPYPYSGVYADIGVTMFVSLVCAIVAAHKSTRFLLRFGTSRFSVWVGNILSLSVGMIAFLLATLMLSMLTGGLVMLLSGAFPQAFAVKSLFSNLQGIELFQSTLNSALRSLPSYMLYTVEWTCLFYLLGCCLRKNRAVTIFVIVGVPMLLMLLTLIPALRHSMEVIQNANEQQRLLLGVQWMAFLSQAMHFVEREWPLIQLIAALISLPLSYLCMRETQQP